MKNGIRVLVGWIVGAVCGIATVAGWWLLVLMLFGGGIDYPEIQQMAQMASVAALWDGATGLLWGAGLFRPDFAKGWGAGALARVSTALLLLVGFLQWNIWFLFTLAMLLPLGCGLWVTGQRV